MVGGLVMYHATVPEAATPREFSSAAKTDAFGVKDARVSSDRFALGYATSGRD